ncbi:MAG: hypothetical protein O7G85_07190 [Planctomycetota bacterium]|nr:hypothetical protein [Planctomycetota bacterium]
MSYYKRLSEYATQRYDQEVTRAQQAGQQRTFYFGLLGGLLAAVASLVHEHGIIHNRESADFVFWTFVFLAGIGSTYTFVQLVMAISPFKVGYWPLPREMRLYADKCHEYYVATNEKDEDSKVIEDIERVIAKRVEEVTTHNHRCNNLRAAKTTRCFWGLVFTGPVVLAIFIVSLFNEPSPPQGVPVGDSSMTENQVQNPNDSTSQESSESVPELEPDAQSPSKPPEPKAIYIVEGTKEASSPPSPPE